MNTLVPSSSFVVSNLCHLMFLPKDQWSPRYEETFYSVKLEGFEKLTLKAPPTTTCTTTTATRLRLRMPPYTCHRETLPFPPIITESPFIGDTKQRRCSDVIHNSSGSTMNYAWLVRVSNNNPQQQQQQQQQYTRHFPSCHLERVPGIVQTMPLRLVGTTNWPTYSRPF